MGQYLGGVGTYAVLGARLVAGRHNAKKIGYLAIFDELPGPMMNEIMNWETGIEWPCLDSNSTPTAQITPHKESSSHGIELVTIRNSREIWVEDFVGHAQNFLSATVFHITGNPERCSKLVEDIIVERKQKFQQLNDLIFVWQPSDAKEIVDKSFHPGNESEFIKACKKVQVFSPHANDLKDLIGEKVLKVEDLDNFSRTFLMTSVSIDQELVSKTLFEHDYSTLSWYHHQATCSWTDNLIHEGIDSGRHASRSSWNIPQT